MKLVHYAGNESGELRGVGIRRVAGRRAATGLLKRYAEKGKKLKSKRVGERL
jgi:hypothetical protein